MRSLACRASVLAFLCLCLSPAPGDAQSALEQMSSLSGRMTATTEIGATVAMPLVDEELTVEIDAQHATTRLRQTYHNSSNMPVEGLYALDAGPGARAEGFAYWNGEEKIVGEVFERSTARRVYESVVRRRRDPGLLEEKGEGVFTFRVAPIVANERKRVEVTYNQWLGRRGTMVEYRAPVARPNTEVHVTIDDPRELWNFESPTHAIEARRLQAGRVLIRAHKAFRDASQFVLRYEIADRPWTLAGYVHRERGRDGHFTLTLAAPVAARAEVVSKDVTLVIDRSGSMSGEAIRQARAACVDIIRRLRPEDHVNVIAFDSDVDKLYASPRQVTEAIRRQATDYVDLLRDGGGTNLAGALTQALEAQEAGTSARPRVVLFFTDGKSDTQAVLAAAAADKRDVRVFTVGFGTEVDRRFLSRLAAMKRGRFTFISSAADIERDVAILYNQIGAPVLVDLSLEVSGAAMAEVYPRTLPDLFVDDELRISGRLRGDRAVTFTLRGRQKGRPVAYRASVALPVEARRPWVGRQWAQVRVDDLLQEIALGGEKSEIKDEVIDLALAYNFATPYTAFLAIPASELDPSAAHELATARTRKAEALARRPDAARPAGGDMVAQAEERDQLLGKAMPPPASSSAPESGEENPLDEREASAPRRKRVYEESESSSPRKGGCAHCAYGGSDGSPISGVVVLALVALVMAARRRRRD